MNTKLNVLRLRMSNPRMTMNEIADRTGVTKQRVFAILKKEGYPTAGIKKSAYCLSCGVRLPQLSRKYCSLKCRSEGKSNENTNSL